jgi:hypothetical protein
VPDVKVRIKGLPELRRAFLQVEGGEKGALKSAFLPIAGRIAGSVSGKVPKLTGLAAASVKARATDRGASIAVGGQAVPYYPWLDFGGSVGRGDRIKRPYLPEGRYLYPTIRAARPEIEDAAGDAILGLAKRAGFEVKGG